MTPRAPKRVLVIGERYADSFADNLCASLDDAGHDVACVGPFRLDRTRLPRLQARLRAELAMMPELAARLQRHVSDAAEQHQPELVINLDYRLSFLAVTDLRAVSAAPIVFWYPDSPGNLGRETHVLAGYDAVFLKDSVTVQRYRDGLGLNSVFLPEACNPRWHRPPVDAIRSSSGAVMVAGNVNATRFKVIQALLERGLHVQVYGPRWARWLPSNATVRRSWTGEYLVRETKARAFRSASVVLNTLASHEADGMNCRLFEAAGCGAVVLTERRDRLEEFFRVPGEVWAYSSLDELVEKARHLINFDAGARRVLGDAASARAHREHTYAHRFDSMCKALGCG